MERIKKLLIAVLAMLLFLTLMYKMIHFTSIKSGKEKNSDFYAQEENYDILIFGSSHAVMGIFPMELWQEYGMISYNLGNYEQYLPVDYWVLKNALRYTTPKLVILDAYMVMFNEKHTKDHTGFLHEMFDPMPNSVDKLNAINDLFSDDLRKEFLVPFSTNHSRWELCDESFFRPVISTYQKGADSNAALGVPSDRLVTSCEPLELLPTEQKNDTMTTGKVYLEKIISLCKENDIEIMLVITPFAADAKLQEWINSVSDIAKKHHVIYINGIQEEIVDTYTDLWDIGHLNESGARKWTRYLGAYIQAHEFVENQKENPSYTGWHKDYEKYLSYHLKQLKEQEVLYHYLMMLDIKKYDIYLKIPEDSNVYKDDTAIKLIKNIGVEGFSEMCERKAAFCCLTADSGKTSEIEEKIKSYSPEKAADIEIAIIDHGTSEIIDYVCFSSKTECNFSINRAEILK